MESNAQRLLFRLNDIKNGVSLTPDNVNILTLGNFLSEVQTFIKGNESNSLLNETQVLVEEGSLQLSILLPTILIQSITHDSQILQKTQDLEAIQPKRAEILEKWQQKARSQEKRSYAWSLPNQADSFRIHKDSTLERKRTNTWVAVETYLSGTIVDLGGKTKANVHLVLTDGKTHVISASEQKLSALEKNYLYQKATIHVRAEEHIHQHTLRNLKLIEIIPKPKESDKIRLNELWENGRKAWADIDHANTWVEELRGH